MTDNTFNTDNTTENNDSAGLPENLRESFEAEEIQVHGELAPEEAEEESARTPLPSDPAPVTRLRGMFRNWFLDYASYVILERAVPHIDDGLKPVQRRILHSMKTLDDGRFNKVANIVGNTMQYHPHGDASIYDALVQLGQKDLLVETQGNWGNILTGASAAAGRYIEARLSPFALETLFNPKTTEWTMSYDGRKKEPVALPVKFPLLLFQGVEGIAVGLSSKILPHNFNELIDASVAYLRGEEFTLYPDFVTGAMIDVSRYNDGERGGAVRIRAKIEKVDNKTIAITEIPFSRTTPAVIESIIKAMEKGKIKIKKVDDFTAETVRIIVTLLPNTSSDKTIDALYAFTDCEISISPNCCVIGGDKPCFLGVSDVLRHSVDKTRELLGRELEIILGETMDLLHFASLEKIFIEKRIYKDKDFEQAPDMDSAVAHVRARIVPLAAKAKLQGEITDDDILRLMEIKMKRILKFSSDDADRIIAGYNDKIRDLRYKLDHLTEHTIAYYEALKEKYGHDFPRRTIIRSFDNIDSAKVAEANEKLYINREEGIIGTSLKKDEFVANCSMLDDVIIFYKDGRYKIVRVAEKLFVDKDIIYINVFKKGDTRTTYNAIYLDGKGGTAYMKRFNVTGITRDKEYNLTAGTPGSRVIWFSANPNGEAEAVKVTLKPKQRLRQLQFVVDFADMSIKGKGSKGNIVTRNEIHRLSRHRKGVSTLGGRQVWFDPDVLRLNYEGRGELLGEFFPDDLILVILKNGEFFTCSFDDSNHFPDNILRIEKFRPGHHWTAVLYDKDQQNAATLKRFTFEPTPKHLRYLGENTGNTLICLTDAEGARFKVTFGGHDSYRPEVVIVAREFRSVKSFRARGKRLSTYTIESIEELEPLLPDEEIPVDEEIVPPTDGDDPAEGGTAAEETDIDRSDDEVRDEINGQKRIF